MSSTGPPQHHNFPQHQPPCLAMTRIESGLSTWNIKWYVASFLFWTFHCKSLVFSFSSFLHLLFLQLPFLCRWRDLPCRATMQVTYTAERSKQNLWQTASQYQPPCLAMTWTESGLSTRNIICCIIPLLDVSLQECPLLFFFFFFFHLLFLPWLCR